MKGITRLSAWGTSAASFARSDCFQSSQGMAQMSRSPPMSLADHDPVHRLQQRRLAGAVGADDRHVFPAANLERYVAQNPLLSDGDGELAGFEHDVGVQITHENQRTIND